MPELIIALDMENLDDCKSLCDKLENTVRWYKIGSVLFTKYGPPCINFLKKKEKKVFLDLKYHDIPNTVKEAVKNAMNMGVDMLNIHASGGVNMMKAAVEEAKTRNPEAIVIAVTVLTSFDQSSFSNAMNRNDDYKISEHVIHLAKISYQSGIDGVVCSSHEISMIKKQFGKAFLTVVPGIRPSWELSKDDQKRIMSPAQAVKEGADYLVVGRPIIKSNNPAESALKIISEFSIH
ncbi:MAG TPA: orotidine-5'-phosphate decarboxylase [Victivallales bacterium]|nr:orotidine-5'-phosphate decarboxylase [Victivallales bacterium]HPO90249.1 orotidine-5'-phosphate decarboxylase [Victivallales bacterium]HRR06211.1 orotidine-5'-phosphate decarboxylase [Victivallales bacterium]HRR28853.1 orotidine-5'-phosphate decarboxylase [Victivallales bacterium]HRU01388.1 orotidine-5'-phosphate decarboxylase [Victivallales bacterium]